MKITLLTLFICFIVQTAFSQISGKFTTASGEPVPFANVLLLSSKDSSLVKGTLTDEYGAYQLENIAQGRYILRMSSIGYQTWHSPVFELAAAEAIKDFGTQPVESSTTQLEAIEIRADKPLYEQAIDRNVVNVESSILTKGSSALDVLERSPGVLVDRQNDGLALNGKGGVTVMINGKLMRLPVSQVVSLLKGMSADNIEKIELLTTPAAKYDAEGNGGMINIVLKKSGENGTNGSFSLTGGYGWGEKGAGSLNLTHSQGKVNLYGNYSYAHDRSSSYWASESTQHMPALGGKLAVDFLSRTKPVQDNHNATIGFDATLNKTTIGSSISYNHSLNTSAIANRGQYVSQADSFLLMLANVDGSNRWQHVITNFYVEKATSEGEKLTLDLDYLYYHNNRPTGVNTAFYDREATEVEPEGSIFSSRQRGTSQTPVQVGVVKLDYTKKLNNKLSAEMGVKGTYTHSSSVSGIESLVDNQWVGNARTSNNIRMKEGIGAMYSSFQWQINPSTQLSAGLRYEYSHTQMNAEKPENNINRRFGKLFPSILFSRKLNDKSDLQVSYTKRITRPSYTDLTSFMTYVDPMAVFTGNPSLQPVVTNNLKVGYTYQGYAFSLLYSRDKNAIAWGQLTENPTKDLMHVSSQNLDYQNNLTFQASIPLKVTSWWQMNYGLVGGWRQFKLAHTEEKLVKNYVAYSLQGTHTVELPKSFFLEVSGWYNSLQYNGSQKLDGFGMLNVGVKKELKNNRGSIQLAITDVLQTMNMHMYFGHLTREAFDLKSHVNYNAESRNSRIIKLTYAKSFGNHAINKQKQRGTGSKDEQERVKK